MNHKELLLTHTDIAILESYKNLVKGFEDYLGDGFEIVLHSLESMEHSVISIANGHLTGRQPGSPITDVALNMLSSIEQDESEGFISYFSTNRTGEPLKSSTIAIYGENKQVIGLLCINFYLNTPVVKLLEAFSEPTATKNMFISEAFVNDTEDLLLRVVERVKQEVELENHILPSLKNKEIITRCNDKGIFKIKNAVNSVAKLLDISKNTVYLHLKSI